MASASVHTTQLHLWLERLRAGDLSARDELLRTVGDRLEHLARKMLRRQFARVKRWVETGDVLQGALVRLLRSLDKVEPDAMRDFYNLAAVQIRRELLDLTRHFFGPRGPARFHAATENADAEPSAFVDRREDPDDLERWAAFHLAVERLPNDEREVVNLIFYHGWDQAGVAELFGVSKRTIRRMWHSACVQLNGELAGDLPDLQI
jgi:RNA polymerase sigma-70 factor (ECF subfamily)